MVKVNIIKLHRHYHSYAIFVVPLPHQKASQFVLLIFEFSGNLVASSQSIQLNALDTSLHSKTVLLSSSSRQFLSQTSSLFHYWTFFIIHVSWISVITLDLLFFPPLITAFGLSLWTNVEEARCRDIPRLPQIWLCCLLDLSYNFVNYQFITCKNVLAESFKISCLYMIFFHSQNCSFSTCYNLPMDLLAFTNPGVMVGSPVGFQQWDIALNFLPKFPRV
jgi:hypothetical protein